MSTLSEMKDDLIKGSAKANGTDGNTKSQEPSPSRGASVPDYVALGRGSESQDQWRQSHGIDKTKQVKIVKVAHMRYQHPDLEEITTFLRDFDQYCYYAQQGPKEFLGGVFEVETYQDLEKVTKLSDAECISNGILTLSEAPGGGYIATIRDPAGFPVNFIHGQEPAEVGNLPEKLILNDESSKPRLGKFRRFEPGPVAVHKLGHFGLAVRDFDTTLSFYTQNFNIVQSDYLYVPVPSELGGEPTRKHVGVFGHIDRGQDHVDHHSLFLVTLVAGGEPHVHHCSFEIHDFDTQYLGHQWLAKKKYNCVWGVGRHILGSQISDYWWDTTGFMIEHYADGDLVNEKTPVGYLEAGDESLAVWAPDVPKEFLD